MARFSHTRKSRRTVVAEINLVPFIDVMLVLLIIFMITTPLLTQGVRVTLPQATTQVLPKKQEPLIVTVDAKGQFYLNTSKHPGQPVTARTLAALSALELQEENQKRTVLVRGDRAVNYGKIMEAMVILQHSGAVSVGLITQSDNRAEQIG